MIDTGASGALSEAKNFTALSSLDAGRMGNIKDEFPVDSVSVAASGAGQINGQ